MATGFYSCRGSIYAMYRVQTNGRSITLLFYPGIIIEDKNGWDCKKQKAKDPQIDAKLVSIRQAINDVVSDNNPFNLTNESFSKLINEKLKPRKLENKKAEQQQTSFYRYCDLFYQETAGIIGERRAKTIKTTINTIKKFRPNLTFEQIDKVFYRELMKWLNNQQIPKGKDKDGNIIYKNMAKNTVGTYIKDLKRILNYATENDANTNLTYQSFKRPSEEVFNIYLTEQEIEKIYRLNIDAAAIASLHEKGSIRWGGQHIQTSIDSLNRARKLLTIGCWSGLRVECYLSIDPDIQILTEGKNQFLHAILNKNGPKLKIPLHKFVREIVKDGWPEPMSEQNFNEQVKVLGKLAGINEPVIFTRTEGGRRVEHVKLKHDLITSHTARRSFASNLIIRGIPRQFVMAATGHHSESSFNKYIRQALKDVMTAKLADYEVWN